MDCNQAGIDLHIHTNASDGTLSASEILRLAEKIGLEAIAITDHDTVDGVIAAQTAGIPESIDFLTGIEISAAMPRRLRSLGSCHILGYGIDPENPSLKDALHVLQDARRNRNPRIIEKLQELNLDITMDDVILQATNDHVGRPHIANTLKKKKIVSTIDEAFEKYLAPGRPGYVDKYRIGCRDAIRLIRDAMGVPVLAHPFLINGGNRASLCSLIIALKDMGLMGLEVYYPAHPPDVASFLADIARRHGLLITGGTDFHGEISPHIQMGRGEGDMFIPYELYEKLVRANHARHVATGHEPTPQRLKSRSHEKS